MRSLGCLFVCVLACGSVEPAAVDGAGSAGGAAGDGATAGAGGTGGAGGEGGTTSAAGAGGAAAGASGAAGTTGAAGVSGTAGAGGAGGRALPVCAHTVSQGELQLGNFADCGSVGCYGCVDQKTSQQFPNGTPTCTITVAAGQVSGQGLGGSNLYSQGGTIACAQSCSLCP